MKVIPDPIDDRKFQEWKESGKSGILLGITLNPRKCIGEKNMWVIVDPLLMMSAITSWWIPFPFLLIHRLCFLIFLSARSFLSFSYTYSFSIPFFSLLKRFLPDKSSIISCDRMLVQRKYQSTVAQRWIERNGTLRKGIALEKRNVKTWNRMPVIIVSFPLRR